MASHDGDKGRLARQDSPWVRWPLTIAALAVITWLFL